MNKIYVVILLCTLLACAHAYAGHQPTVPSFDEFSAWSRRHPDTDTNLDLYHRSWRSSLPHTGHGGLIEQEIFFPGNPLNPARCGEVLKHLKEFNHAFLPGNKETELTKHDKLQVMFLIMKGAGRVEVGGETVDISGGSGVFVPSNLTYRFINTSSEPLEMYLFSEEISDGFTPITHIEVGNFHEHPPGTGNAWHWVHNNRSVLRGKFENPLSFGIITIDAFDIAHPHVAPIGIEEIWLQLEGTSLMYFGNRLFRHEPGEAFYITPNYKVPHCSINPSDKPMLWMYIGIRHDKEIPVTKELQALIDSLTVKE